VCSPVKKNVGGGKLVGWESHRSKDSAAAACAVMELELNMASETELEALGA
jgi:hypothetical protein